jgi:para-nitrobenzyl esterase
MAFACPGRALNRWASDKIPTYAYEFADRTAPSYLEPTTFAMGAAHTFELAYLFPGFHGGAGKPVELNPLQAKLADKMVDYWSTAGLAAERETQWPRYTPEQDDYLSLTLPEPRMTSKIFADVHNCGFWDRTGIY